MKMTRRWLQQRMPVALAAVAAMLVPGLGRAAEPVGTRSAPGIDIVCVAERPALVAGASTPLQAVVTSAEGQPVKGLNLDWMADAGRIEGAGNDVQWNLSAEKVPAGTGRTVHAIVKATAPGVAPQSCTVEVRIGAKPVDDGPRSLPLISARHYLLPNGPVDGGFGLYSYLLFSAPPKDAEERARYLKTIAACLLQLQDVDDYLALHLRFKQLNALYIPLKELPAGADSSRPLDAQRAAELAARVLQVYDYRSAAVLLSQVNRDHPSGPYLVSVLNPLSTQSTAAASDPVQPHLWEDLTGVVPDLAWDWMKFFSYLAAQQRSWSEESLQRFALNLRNLVAVGGKVTPATAAALRRAIRYVK